MTLQKANLHAKDGGDVVGADLMWIQSSIVVLTGEDEEALCVVEIVLKMLFTTSLAQ